jgi:predicted O-methyltransferase YrrM
MQRTPEAYAAAFERERVNEYPVIDALEARLGFAVDRERLEAAARVLACPVKKNPPNWAHGRLLYALGRSYLAHDAGEQYWLDVGSAKGYSAVCMAWAFDDSAREGRVLSMDVIDPNSREPRNSVDDSKTLAEFTQDYMPMGSDVMFMRGSAADVIGNGEPERINFAFIDGSHQYENVKSDIATVTPRQQSGDIILFDDLQAPGVARAVSELQGYDLEHIEVLPTRKYAIAVKP